MPPTPTTLAPHAAAVLDNVLGSQRGRVGEGDEDVDQVPGNQLPPWNGSIAIVGRLDSGERLEFQRAHTPVHGLAQVCQHPKHMVCQHDVVAVRRRVVNEATDEFRLPLRLAWPARSTRNRG